MTEDKKSKELDLDSMMQCDCSDCQQPKIDAMAITRAKSKPRPPIDWEDQKAIREDVLDAVQKEQQENN